MFRQTSIFGAISSITEQASWYASLFSDGRQCEDTTHRQKFECAAEYAKGLAT
jgi:hypothetical protein